MEKMFDIWEYPDTMDYTIKHITKNRRCKECGAIAIQWADNETQEETPYECLSCEYGLDNESTVIGEDFTFEEFESVVRALIPLRGEDMQLEYQQYRKDWYKARVEDCYVPGPDEEPVSYREWWVNDCARRFSEEEDE